MVYTPTTWADGDIITAAKANRLENAVSQNAAAIDGVSKTTVGLANVDNTSDAAKPISNAQAAVNASKADLVNGAVPAAQSRVASVAGRTGAVTLTTNDLGDATAIGRNIAGAADAAAVRTLIGAAASGSGGSSTAAFSFTDAFGRATGPVGSNYQQFIRYSAADSISINSSNRAYRTTSASTPGGETWADGVILSQNCGSLAQRVVISNVSTDAQDAGAFNGYPGVSCILRGPGAKLARGGTWTANNSGAVGVGHAIFAMLKKTNFFVFVGSPGANTNPNANDAIQNGWCAIAFDYSGYVSGTKDLAVQITADDMISATYGGVQILAPTYLPGAPQGKYMGFSPGSLNGSLSQFVATTTLV